MESRVVGQTKDAGCQFGIRRTFPVSRERAWAYLLSPEGLRVWLGSLPSMDLQEKAAYRTSEGTTGEFRVVRPHEQLRLTWRPPEWEQDSTFQIRLLDAGEGKTTVAFHQEKLRGPMERERMKRRLEEAMAVLSEKFSM